MIALRATGADNAMLAQNGIHFVCPEPFVYCVPPLTGFDKITVQGTPYIMTDKEVIDL